MCADPPPPGEDEESARCSTGNHAPSQRPQTPLLHPRRRPPPTSRSRISPTACSPPRTASPRASASRSAITCSISGSSRRTAGSTSSSPAVFAAPQLNPFMALGPKVWSSTRARISELLRHDHPELRDNEKLRKRALVPMADVKLHLPFAVSGYTDFYSSKEHATNVGVMFRGKDNALAAELAAYADRLQRPRLHRRRQRHAGAAAARAVEAADGRGAELRALQAARFRTRNGRGGRPAVGDGRDADREAGRGNDLRLRDPQRLERARHPAMGVCAARAVPGQGVRDLDQPVGGDARGAGAVPLARPGAGPEAAALSAAGAAEQLRHGARGRPARGADERGRETSAAPISNTCTGRRCSSSCTTPQAAAP